jgi:hypothetical protein
MIINKPTRYDILHYAMLCYALHAKTLEENGICVRHSHLIAPPDAR